MEIALIIIVALSVILHEVAHGYAANWLGDPTARLSGRLTLNPIVHIDPVGSVILPFLLIMSHAPFFIGYAKPVPYNPYNLTNQKWGEAIVAVAGPATNLLLALIFGLIIRFASSFGFTESFISLASQIVVTNLVLAFLNLIPIPPADGSKVIAPLLPYKFQRSYVEFGNKIGMFGIFLLFGFIFVFQEPFLTLVRFIFSVLTGFSS